MFAFFAIIGSMQKAQLEPTAFAADECQQIGGSFSANKRGAIFLIIRPSKPDDAPQVAPLIDIVFTEMEIPQLMKVPKKTLYSVLEQAFLLPTYRYGYPQMLVADQDGQIEGIAVGYLHEQEAHIDDALKPLLPKLGLTPNSSLFSDTETYAGEWYLDTLAVAETAQGHGIGTKLLNAVDTVARARHAKVVSLNVDQQNLRAKKLYERNGFLKHGELMIGSHRYDHMLRPVVGEEV